MSDISLRDSQQKVVGYSGGKMGVAAVPGAGKTFTLSYLAAQLVERLGGDGDIEEQEVLIVTLTNSAVNSFRKRIADLLRTERGLLPYVGYRVRTLHGLANDIVRMRPGLVGLSESFDIVDERVATAITADLAENWVRTSWEDALPYIGGKFDNVDDPRQVQYFLRNNGIGLIEDIANVTIRLAKDKGWEPDEMRAKLAEAGQHLALATIGIELYEAYQRSLGYRGAVDFNDLIRLAMEAFELDPDFLERIQRRWPYILEDEAQDSSESQDRMLRALSSDTNWVRVGDPNQSIYTTFTTANANILRGFIEREKGVNSHPLPESGRSSPHIIRLANELVRWSRTAPDFSHLKETFFPQDIIPTRHGDPQPNPPNGQVYIDWEPGKNITPEREISRVARSLEKWLPDHKDWTVAVLVPENTHGFKVAEALKELEIPYEELLRSTSATRNAAGKLQAVFDFLSEPTNGRALARLYRDVWWPLSGGDEDDEAAVTQREEIAGAMHSMTATEDFLWPGPEGGWGPEWKDGEPDPALEEMLTAFRAKVRLWLEATLLPVDQLLLTVSGELFTNPTDLALAHKIAVVLRGISDNNIDYRLPELTQELRVIADNQRRFLGFDDAGDGYEPVPGQVTIATMHAAKGLEWDRVYLMSVNNYSFPSGTAGDSYIGERWFIRDELNIQAETGAQLELLMDNRAGEYREGDASLKARVEYAQERLRLLYVGITRARRDLIMMWNMGRFWDRGNQAEPAQALIALHSFWEKELKS